MAAKTPGPDAAGSDYARRVREALRVRCVHLKTKRSFLGAPTAPAPSPARARPPAAPATRRRRRCERRVTAV
jgi:hypothetical protein